jgi:hypothetical protein
MATENQRSRKEGHAAGQNQPRSRLVLFGAIILVVAVVILVSFAMHTIHPQS